MNSSFSPDVSNSNFSFDVRDIFSDGSVATQSATNSPRVTLTTHFQSITSIRRRSVIGVEALSRGEQNGKRIAPQQLFEEAHKQNCVLELDRACRESAIRAFAPLHLANREMILFVNLTSESAIADLSGEHCLLKVAREYGVDPRNIAIEILEAEFHDVDLLCTAVKEHRKMGFLVALDDIGAGFANLDRIAQIKPDILKIDRSLVAGMDADYHQREVFKSLVVLSEKIGGWIITEGVETQNEAVTALDLGGDMMQGFYFSRPCLLQDARAEYGHEQIEATAKRFKSQVLVELAGRRRRRVQRLQAAYELCPALSRTESETFETLLRERIGDFPNVESVCVLDDQGVQITETVLNDVAFERAKSVIFAPPPRGTDHSMKEYFYAVREGGVDPFETGPYVPLPSGDLCITLAKSFSSQEQDFILCVHFLIPLSHFDNSKISSLDQTT